MMKVLLVDDDQISNLLNQKTLQRLGIVSEVHTALNGEEAITLLNDYFHGSLPMPDIILLDLNMPIMDGFSFIEAFHKLPLPNKENVRIIIVTSSQNPTDIDRAKSLGVVHFITKPISENNLRIALEG